MATRKRRMSYNEIIQLLELYRKNELLWNYSHPHYKSKHKRLQAFESIRIKANVESIDEVKRRLKVIRDTYNIEKNKMNESKRSGAGAVYLTKLPWYETANEFLSLCEGRESHSNNRNDQSATKSESVENSVIKFDSTTSYKPFDSASSSGSVADLAVCIKHEELQIDEDDYNEEYDFIEETPRPASVQKRKSTATTEIATTPNADPSNVPPHISTVLDTLKILRASEAQPIQDEFQYFGLNLAAQLRELPMLRALVLQEKLQKIVSQERIDYESSRITSNMTAGNGHADGSAEFEYETDTSQQIQIGTVVSQSNP